jgi:hypothetical protein
MKNILGIIIICLLFFSCRKKADIEEPKPEESIVPEIVSEPAVVSEMKTLSSERYVPVFEYEYNYEPLSEEEIERLSLILYEQEERYLEGWVKKILLIQKVNFAVPNGDNFIVLWEGVQDGTYKNDHIILYSISDKIENRYYIGHGGVPITVVTNFNIMENIPGFHIRATGASIFDFNGDGIDELFLYGFFGMGNFIGITGYDAEKNEMAAYCDYVGFSIIDKNFGPAPLEFTRYKNRIGFKVYGQYDPNIPPVNLINNYYAWYFYTWNDETKQYENIGEYLQNDTDTKYNIHSFSLNYFYNRIQIEGITGEFESLTDLVEVNANIEGGRSFNATVRIYSGEIYERIFDFDSNGVRGR